MTHSRYAIYYAPPSGSGLARFGASWLGWDADAGAACAHPDTPVDVATLTERPRKYGFHGTLKPPFRLAEGMTLEALDTDIRALAARRQPFVTAPLVLRRLGPFFALVVSEPSDDLAALAAACVRELDPFRAPLTEADLAKRRAGGLSQRQEALLAEWGYPYVMEEFRFHLTLSGPVASEEAERVEAPLRALTAPYCVEPFQVQDLTLFGEREDGAFEIIRRYPLG